MAQIQIATPQAQPAGPARFVWSHPERGVRLCGFGETRRCARLPPADGRWFGALAFGGTLGPAWSGFAPVRFFRPQTLRPSSALGPLPPPARIVHSPGERERWDALVARALEAISAGALRKVVLARAIEVEADAPLHPETLLAALEARHPSCRCFLVRGDDGSAFIGATPELLCRIEGDRLETEALAGSAHPRDAQALLRSHKDLREHRWVLEHILGALPAIATEIEHAGEPRLRLLANVAHLHTPIRARLRPGCGVAEVVAALHPTPAVGGVPARAALRFIAEHEGLDRGLYAGLLGFLEPGPRGAGGGAALCARARPARAAVRGGRHRRGIFGGAGVRGDGAESSRAARRAGGRTMNRLWARAVADELRRGGVRDAVICPGSRSAPLALALAEALRAHTIIDERSGAFFALGAARASQRPVAVLATSGTAGAHFHPALLEAAASGVRLVALTADRPPELHGWGAPQTTDQQRMFGAQVPFADLGVPDAALLPHLRATVARALQGDGPVHLNAPFREPLAPMAEPLHSVRDEPALRHLHAPPAVPDVRDVARELAARPRGAIVCGPRDLQDDLPAAVRELSRALGYAVLADATSGIRDGCAHADLVLREEAWARALQPDAVLRMGGGVSSKLLQALVDRASYTAVLHERGEPVDPAHRAAVLVEGDAPAICRALAAKARAPGPLGALWAEADARARAALESGLPWGEPLVARKAALSAELLYVSSSMPVRDVDAFAPRRARVLANRGLNGIDGVVSSAAGAAAVTGARTVALVGDLALLHDLGGLVAAARLQVPLTILCVNNDGGGIFHFLPIAQAERFEELFVTAHGLDLSGAARLCGAEFHRVSSARELRAALSLPPALRLIEARTDRRANVEQHRALQAMIARALGEPPP